MKRILVVGEDALTCALGERLVAQTLPAWTMPNAPINAKGITKLLPSLPRYIQQARHVQPVLCVADTDHKCPAEVLKRWLPGGVKERFLFRLAVTEAESWVMADREALARFFAVPIANIPSDPGQVPDAKREILRLARHSKIRQLRQEIVSGTDLNKPGTGYNIHLSRFVQEHWRASEAAQCSESLSRAIRRLTELGADGGTC